MSLNTPTNLKVSGKPRNDVVNAVICLLIAINDQEDLQGAEDQLDDTILAYVKARNGR